MFTDAAALAIALAAIGSPGGRPTFAGPMATTASKSWRRRSTPCSSLPSRSTSLFEAYQRFRNPPEIQSTGMLVIATIGLVVNMISIRLLSGGKDSSLN